MADKRGCTFCIYPGENCPDCQDYLEQELILYYDNDKSYNKRYDSRLIKDELNHTINHLKYLIKDLKKKGLVNDPEYEDLEKALATLYKALRRKSEIFAQTELEI